MVWICSAISGLSSTDVVLFPMYLVVTLGFNKLYHEWKKLHDTDLAIEADQVRAGDPEEWFTEMEQEAERMVGEEQGSITSIGHFAPLVQSLVVNQQGEK